jgi:hypothetical protein
MLLNKQSMNQATKQYMPTISYRLQSSQLPLEILFLSEGAPKRIYRPFYDKIPEHRSKHAFGLPNEAASRKEHKIL